MQHLLFGMLTNRASVEQHDVRIVDAVGIDVTGAAQDCAHRLRIGDVHLTSVGLEVNPRMRRTCCSIIHKTTKNLRPRRAVDTTRLTPDPCRKSSLDLNSVRAVGPMTRDHTVTLYRP